MNQFTSLGHFKNYLESKKNPCIIFFENFDNAIEFSDLLGDTDIYYPWELLPFEPYFNDIEKTSSRFHVINKLINKKTKNIATSILSLYQKIGDMHLYKKYFIEVKNNIIIENREKLIEKLIRMGYERQYEVRYPGQFSVRGEIIDIYEPSHDLPTRIIFDDMEVEKIKSFNPETQLSVEELTSLLLTPLKEIVFDKEINFDRLMDYDLPVLEFMENETYTGIEKDFPLIYERYNRISNLIPKNYNIFVEKGNKRFDIFHRNIEKLNKLDNNISRLKSFFWNKDNLQDFSNFEIIDKTERYEKLELNITEKKLIQNLDLWINKNYNITIYFDNQAKLNYFKNNIYKNENLDSVNYKIDYFSGSYIDKKSKEIFISENEVLGRIVEDRNIEYAKGYKSKENIIGQLNKGDLIVHIDYGIGIYRGVINDTIAGKKGDYVLIEYKKESKIYVPVDNLDKVEKYIGNKKNVRINSLGDNLWRKTKKKVKNKVRDFAVDLLKLQAERKLKEGYSYSEDTEWQKNFEESFIHEETPDQIRAIQEIKNDMESSKVMERLLCGDVGFGKTEVAMRAAFKAVQDGKQVVLLAPTTVLAIQHFKTFKDRMIEYPIKIEMLSRLVKKSREKKIVKGIKEGTVDIIIGTHKVLNEKILYDDLGLLIIDEEQRFGVMQKEKLKDKKKNVDMLTLTATPIPRTLYMSLVGIMDLSRLETPPKNRHPIKTKSIKFDEELIREIIFRELKREGQIYFIHNRVKDIRSITEHLEEITDERVSIEYVHGQMNPNRIESRILNFMHGKIDLLVSTTIIENGIDISNVNTIIVNNAHHFGLSQLYQLRGRVGRREVQAYSYLIVPPVTNRIAKQRINALLNFEHLGAGYEISMRDLEIRGAGNLIGQEQSGYMNMIGYELYTKLLKQTVAELKGEKIEEEISVNIDIGYEGLIPDFYIKKGSIKIEFYKRIYDAKDESRLEKIKYEMEDRYGPLPDEVEDLFDFARIKLLMKKNKILSIEKKANRLYLVFTEEMETDYLVKIVEYYKDKIEFDVTNNLEVILKVQNKNIIKEIEIFMKLLNN
ncbi:MAG TPA: transcription-repair coupling factor [Candidatus Mcinerneyibacterium sp.]|nr:transcription-repair coupling factor [Candidatus Mcinerneyibacterium sp.]